MKVKQDRFPCLQAGGNEYSNYNGHELTKDEDYPCGDADKRYPFALESLGYTQTIRLIVRKKTMYHRLTLLKVNGQECS